MNPLLPIAGLLTGLHFVATSALSWSLVLGGQEEKNSLDWSRIGVLASVTCISIWFSNLSLLLNSVGFYQVRAHVINGHGWKSWRRFELFISFLFTSRFLLSSPFEDCQAVSDSLYPAASVCLVPDQCVKQDQDLPLHPDLRHRCCHLHSGRPQPPWSGLRRPWCHFHLIAANCESRIDPMLRF